MISTEEFKQAWLAHRDRMQEIGAKSARVCAAMGRTNLQQIFHLSLGKVHPSSKLPDEEIDELEELMFDATDTEIQNGSGGGTSGD